MGELRERMIRDMEIKGYSPETQEAYLRNAVGFVRFFGISPTELGEEQVRTYLHHLIVERELSQSYVNQAYSGLKFLYEQTLKVDWSSWKIPRSRKAKKLPVVLSTQEVGGLFQATTNLKHRAMLMTTYSGGLRLSELITLKPADIDSDRMLIHVLGKGNKERFTLLARTALQELREYCRVYRPGESGEWLFPGQKPGTHLSARSFQKIVEQARERAGITKPATVHTLRHSFATHLLDRGVDIYHISRLLGHTDLKTTEVYLHLTSRDFARIDSPLDYLGEADTPAS